MTTRKNARAIRSVRIAALPKIRKMLRKDSTVVCIATGNGLKDQESVLVEIERAPLASDASSLLHAIASH
jgi:threonine synthase